MAIIEYHKVLNKIFSYRAIVIEKYKIHIYANVDHTFLNRYLISFSCVDNSLLLSSGKNNIWHNLSNLDFESNYFLAQYFTISYE